MKNKLDKKYKCAEVAALKC